MTIAILEMAAAPKSANKLNASFCAENLKLFKASELNKTSAVDEPKEFSMTNVQQMNLIGYYYHGHVWGHSSSSRFHSQNGISTLLYESDQLLSDPSYVPLHIVSGGLALRFGFKNFLMITSLIAALLTISFPLLIRTSYIYGLISRVLLGALHSGWFPGK